MFQTPGCKLPDWYLRKGDETNLENLFDIYMGVTTSSNSFLQSVKEAAVKNKENIIEELRFNAVYVLKCCRRMGSSAEKLRNVFERYKESSWVKRAGTREKKKIRRMGRCRKRKTLWRSK